MRKTLPSFDALLFATAMFGAAASFLYTAGFWWPASFDLLKDPAPVPSLTLGGLAFVFGLSVWNHRRRSAGLTPNSVSLLEAAILSLLAAVLTFLTSCLIILGVVLLNLVMEGESASAVAGLLSFWALIVVAGGSVLVLTPAAAYAVLGGVLFWGVHAAVDAISRRRI